MSTPKVTNGYKQRSSKMEIQFSSEVNNFILSAEHHAVVQKQGAQALVAERCPYAEMMDNQ